MSKQKNIVIMGSRGGKLQALARENAALRALEGGAS